MLVSVLFNEPKLLKSQVASPSAARARSFSALQRAEIAEISCSSRSGDGRRLRFSALQRAEIAEIALDGLQALSRSRVSVLFNEPKLLKSLRRRRLATICRVSVLFNEPKLLKFPVLPPPPSDTRRFSALQRAEIAEI